MGRSIGQMIGQVIGQIQTISHSFAYNNDTESWLKIGQKHPRLFSA